MYIFNDEFYESEGDIIEYGLSFDREELEAQPDDFTIRVELAEQQPIVQINSSWIVERIDDERFSDIGVNDEALAIKKILDENIDWESINKLLPTLYYPTRKFLTLTKAELLVILE